MKANLHVHTNHSDGTKTVSEINEQALKNNIDVIGITDHDTLNAAYDIVKLDTTVKFILGVEVSCKYKGETIHILGYFKDIPDKKLIDYFKINEEKRLNRCLKIIDNLEKYYGIKIDYEDVKKRADGLIARPHIAEAICDKIGCTFDEAFDKYEAQKDDGINLANLTDAEMRYLRRDLQLIFQDPYSSLNPRMTVGQIIGEGLMAHNIFKKGDPKMQDYIMEIMEKCGLASYFIHRYPHQFSGGQRQRIGIARSLAVHPKFVVCDEAVSALDVSIQAQVVNMFEELQEKLGVAYLFIAHDLLVVHHISDRIAVMYLGKMMEIADADELNANPIHPYTLSLLSAVPIPDPETARKSHRIVLEGDVPSPLKMPTGCPFRTRCKYATEKCGQEMPQLTDRGNGHMVACWNK